MRFIATLVFVFCVSHTLGGKKENWEAWKEKYGKHYTGEDDERRFNVWQSNYRIVREHNAKYDKGETTYTMTMNKFAAMTPKEFRSILMPESDDTQLPKHHDFFYNRTSTNLPNSVDWENQGLVTGVKNQGQLGSCYSFSAVEAVEGQYKKSTGNLVSFSEMQIVNCDQGGDGGFPYKVYKYLMHHGGLMTGQDYPYVDKVGECEFELKDVVARLNNYKFVRPFGNEDSLQDAVANVGPISVSQIKVFSSFQLYKSGVYYEAKCDGTSDGEGYHAMLATGYGTTSEGVDYWMVKNSWDTDWGENGYIRMSRNRDNNCGIASQPSYPIMARLQVNSVVQETTTQAGNIPQLSLLMLTISFILLTLFVEHA